MRHPHADLIHAWAEGAEIETKVDDTWRKVDMPHWNPNLEYRIKLESTPVAWVHEDELPKDYPYDEMYNSSRIIWGVRMFPLYTTSPQRTWVGLTDNELNECWPGINVMNVSEIFGRNIEAKLKEKNK